MYNTYNMGIGMLVAVSADKVDDCVAAIKAAGETPYIIGEIVNDTKGISFVD